MVFGNSLYKYKNLHILLFYNNFPYQAFQAIYEIHNHQTNLLYVCINHKYHENNYDFPGIFFDQYQNLQALIRRCFGLMMLNY